jgi:hypothetical protein
LHTVHDDATVVGGLTARVENLEKRVELLEALPARISAVGLQIVQLRSEMHEQFSAVRSDLEGFRAESQSGIHAVRNELRAEIKAACDEVRSDLRAEIRAGDEETRRYMRVLHEEVLARLAMIDEGRPRRRQR